MKLELVLKQNKEEVKHYHVLLFPLMGYNVITGFNIYESESRKESKFIISYLHSELDKGKEHREELEEKFRTYFDVLTFRKIRFEKIDRYTSYKLKKGWEAQRYYNIKGEELRGKDLEIAIFRNEIIIGAAYQEDLEISVNDHKDLKHILEIFRRYCNFYEINQISGEYKKSGKGKKIRNLEKITDAWEIPLITVMSDEELTLEQHPQINEVRIEKDRFFISMLVDNRSKILLEFLQLGGESPKVNRLYANKVFVNWINKGLYTKKYKEFLTQLKSVQQQLH